ncbi:MAG TPA: HlyD family efflux transporter periplasmic adaptor subunit [Vicinamibacterales bacterium]
MVDIARSPAIAKRKKIKRAVLATSGLVVIMLITFGVSQLKPAAPSVDRASVWVDTVKRGPMVRAVRGSGTLVPEDIRWINTTTQGRVERILLRPGAKVTPTTVILELSNPELEQQVMDARLAHASALANYTNRKTELERSLLEQQSQLAQIETQYNNSKLNLEAQESLFEDGLVSELTVKQVRSATKDLENRVAIAKKQLEMTRNGISSQLAPQQAEVDQRRAQYELRVRQLDDLKVKAGMAGVLSQVPVEVGQQVGSGTNLARVADPTRLKAEVRIAETQTKDLRIGQLAEVDTRNGIIQGRVSRIDPTATGGTVGVDITLEGDLPPGARPDLSVDGTITLESLPDVIKVGRPAFGQENSTVLLFKLDATGEAHRVQVRLGRTSVNEIEILEGLQPGDQVILSDMSAHDAYDRIRLN